MSARDNNGATAEPKALEAFLAQDEGALEQVDALMADLCGEEAPVGDFCREHLATGGKRIRARLCVAAAGALEGDAAKPRAVPFAAGCELLHNATLVHDDLQDGDRVRRGEPTVWVRHGDAQAINAGDLMLMLPFLAIGRTDASGDAKSELSVRLAQAAATTVRGQALELTLLDAPPSELRAGYFAAIAGKTSALFALPVEGAAVLAGLGAQTDAVSAPFKRLGTLFQLQDDVLDLYGDKGREKVGADLREGKVSSLVVEHLERHPSDREWLTGVLKQGREETRDEDVLRAIDKFRDQGALEAVTAEINSLADEVKSAPALKAQPALGALAELFVSVVLAPVAHVLPTAA